MSPVASLPAGQRTKRFRWLAAVGALVVLVIVLPGVHRWVSRPPGATAVPPLSVE